jgi:hypothetical protein
MRCRNKISKSGPAVMQYFGNLTFPADVQKLLSCLFIDSAVQMRTDYSWLHQDFPRFVDLV